VNGSETKDPNTTANWRGKVLLFGYTFYFFSLSALNPFPRKSICLAVFERKTAIFHRYFFIIVLVVTFRVETGESMARPCISNNEHIA
jgi:hypothetical protein